MTKLKNILFGVIGFLVFAALPLARAQDAQGSDGNYSKIRPGARVEEIYSQLNLTDDQKRQLENNKLQHRAKMEGAKEELKSLKEDIRDELMKSQLDMIKIVALHNKIKELLSQMEDDKLHSVLAVRSILTQEQFLKFINLMHKHKHSADH